MSRYNRSRPIPSEFLQNPRYVPRGSYVDQLEPVRQRARERDMRFHAHPLHPEPRDRERSPLALSRHVECAPYRIDGAHDFREQGFGFVPGCDLRYDDYGRFNDHAEQAIHYNDRYSVDRRGEGSGYRCGENGFYFYADDGFCYDDEGFCYRFEGGFFYDTEAGNRHDSGGYRCDDRGLRLPEYEEESSEDQAEPLSSTHRSRQAGDERDLSYANVEPPRVRKSPRNTDSGDRRRPWLPSSVCNEVAEVDLSTENDRENVTAGANESVPTEFTRTTPPAPSSLGEVNLPGTSGQQPLVIPQTISEMISGWMTCGISTDASRAISKEFALEFADTEFSLKPPKLDGWMSRRALLKSDKNLPKSINAMEDTLTKAQLKIMDIAPPLVDLYARLCTLPDSLAAKRSVEAALQQWGRAYFSITEKRRDSVIALVEPESDFLLRDTNAFDVGREARTFLFTEKYLQAMLTNASQDNTLAQAARTAAAAASVGGRRNAGTRRLRFPEPSGAPAYHPPQYEANLRGRGRRGVRGRRAGRAREPRPNAWAPGSRRYVSINSDPSTFRKMPLNTRPASPLGSVNRYVTGVAPLTVASRLKMFFSNWESITDNVWILNTVRDGLTLDFTSEPVQEFFPPEISMPDEMMSVCDREVRELLVKRAVTEVTNGSDGFVSSFFCVKKKQAGKFRPIVNLKPLNQFIRYQHFKMENLESVRYLVREGDWMVKVDLKDAYFTVAIEKTFKKFLRFRWRGRIYEFNCMAFGLAPAPRVFTKILKVVMAFLRRQGIRIIIYLDDILVLNGTKEGTLADLKLVVDLLYSLGFLINWEKSMVIPSQVMEYLGLIVNSIDLSFSLPCSKAEAVRKMCVSAIARGVVSLRSLASIQGNFSWAIPAIPFAQSHYRSLQRFYIANAQRSKFDLETKVQLTPSAILDLEWWVANIERSSGKMFFPRDPDLEIFSDASLSGWGAVCNGVTTRGPWMEEHRQKHINELELLGALYAIQAFAAGKKGIAVRIFLDNTTAVSYVNKCGGTRSVALTATAKMLSAWCEERFVSLEAVHLAGELNTIADRESRAQADASDWQLDSRVFAKILKLWVMDIDLFAAPWNKQLPRFISWKPQPGAAEVNAFSVSWSNVRGYAFPPFSLIFRCIEKLRREKATIVLVCPIWTGQAWFPTLLEHACDIPRLLRPSSGLLTSAEGIPHPLLQSRAICLAAWKLSGDLTECRDFRNRLSACSWTDVASIPMLHTSQRGTVGCIGVWGGTKIPCLAI